MKTGDIFFQAFPKWYWYATMIDDLQPSDWTHCGIIYWADKWYKFFLGPWWVVESFPFVGTWTIPLWLAWVRLFFMKFSIRELKNRPSPTLFINAALAKIGKSYDYGFRWQDGTEYCSELIYDAYAEATGMPVCNPIQVGQFDAKALIKWHDKIASLQSGNVYNPNQLIITPLQIFNETK